MFIFHFCYSYIIVLYRITYGQNEWFLRDWNFPYTFWKVFEDRVISVYWPRQDDLVTGLSTSHAVVGSRPGRFIPDTIIKMVQTTPPPYLAHRLYGRSLAVHPHWFKAIWGHVNNKTISWGQSLEYGIVYRSWICI